MEHLSQEQIVSYHARSLGAEAVLRVSDHLLQCEACRARVLRDPGLAAGAMAVHASLSSEPGVLTHLTYDEIAGYVDGQLSDTAAETVSLHARECAACARDLREIQDLKAEIGATRSTMPRGSRLSNIWRAVHGWKAMCTLAAAAACVLLVTLAVRLRETNRMARVEPPKQADRSEAPAAPARANTVIHDGRRAITVSADGRVAGLEGLPDRFRGAVEQALATQRVNGPPGIGQLASKRSVLLGAPERTAGARLLQPVGIMVETQHPVFRWKPAANAEYQVSVYDSEFQQAAGSGWIREAEWRTPIALGRGVRYSWQLTVRREGREFTAPEPPEPEARFQILDAAGEADLIRLRSTWSDSNLVMGVAYAQAGLLVEAGKELRALSDQNPGTAGLDALLESVNRPGVNSGRPQSR